jgi:hypothetical protein
MLGDFIRSHKIVTTTVIGFLIVIIGITFYLALSRAGKEPVTIQLIPEDTILTIDGQQYRPGTAYIQPGTHNIKAEREGFRTFESTITIGQPNNTEVDLALTPVSEEAIQWQKDNLNLYLAQEGRSALRSNEIGQQRREQFPITAHLPFRNFIYSIGHRLKNVDNPSEGIIIEINAITGSREAAINKIRELGFDPTDYEINFNNYENPFSHE